MADCHCCNREISYFAAVAGALRYWRVNFRRRMMLVFDCPHCATQCQETALSTYSFVLVALVVALGLAAMVRPHPDQVGAVGFVALAVTYIPLRYLWWRLLARVKEPHVFWWEGR